MSEPAKLPENLSRSELEMMGVNTAIQAVVQILLAKDPSVSIQIQNGLSTVFARLAQKPELMTPKQLETIEEATWLALGIEAPSK